MNDDHVKDDVHTPMHKYVGKEVKPLSNRRFLSKTEQLGRDMVKDAEAEGLHMEIE
jgi:hypothetical protein